MQTEWLLMYTAVWSGSALFAHTYLSENLGSLRYHKILKNFDSRENC